MAAVRRSEVVSAASLSKAIDKAVDLAAKRHDIRFGSENLIVNWDILGRILREKVTTRGAELGIATTIANSISGINGLPVATKIGKDILVGFIERGRSLRQF
jgi:hypothetical protein